MCARTALMCARTGLREPWAGNRPGPPGTRRQRTRFPNGIHPQVLPRSSPIRAAKPQEARHTTPLSQHAPAPSAFSTPIDRPPRQLATRLSDLPKPLLPPAVARYNMVALEKRPMQSARILRLVDPCTANGRRATNGSPVLSAFSGPRPTIGNATINKGFTP
jgi:hypothetical protein